MTALRRILVVGASQAGFSCAAALRQLGFDGAITVIGDEPHPPYIRPPLSKGVLVGKEPDSSVFIPIPEGVEIVTGVKASGLDSTKRTVDLVGGDRLAYDGLVIATGARARRIARGGANAEVTLRGLDDAVSLRERLGAVQSVVVAGGGFLGMEIASSAASLGKSVTVVDRVTPLADRLGPLLSGLLLDAAADWGVSVRVIDSDIDVGFTGGTPDRLLSEGSPVAEGDIVVSAVGDVPNTEWLHGSGLPIEGALLIDDACQVAPHIVAAGDVAARLKGPRYARTPHWSSALSQAQTAAATLLGREEVRYSESAPHFFWTEAFGLKIRLSGQLPPVGEPTVIDGSLSDRRALLVWRGAGPEGSTAAAVNFPISAPKLARLAHQFQADSRTI